MTAVDLTSANSDAIAESALALCLACGELFPAQDIESFSSIPGVGLSAQCPLCGNVSIVPSATGFPLDDKEACDAARKEWELCHARQK